MVLKTEGKSMRSVFALSLAGALFGALPVAAATVSCPTPTNFVLLEYPGYNPPALISPSYVDDRHQESILIWDLAETGYPKTALIAHCSATPGKQQNWLKITVPANMKFCVNRTGPKRTNGTFSCTDEKIALPNTRGRP